MHAAGHGERLAATDFHIAGGVQGKLKDRDACQIQLFQHPGHDILDAVHLTRVGNDGVSRNETVQACIGPGQHDVVAGHALLDIRLPRLAARVIEFPIRPIS